MIDHLQDCFLSKPCHPSLPEHDDFGGELSKCRTCELPCICDELRRSEHKGFMLGWGEGHAAGFKDALGEKR